MKANDMLGGRIEAIRVIKDGLVLLRCGVEGRPDVIWQQQSLSAEATCAVCSTEMKARARAFMPLNQGVSYRRERICVDCVGQLVKEKSNGDQG